MTFPQDAAVRPHATVGGEARPPGNGAPRPGLPAGATVERLPLPDEGLLELATLTLADTDQASGAPGDEPSRLAAVAAAWVALAPTSDEPQPAPGVPVSVPLYGCHVVWSPRRAALVGPASRLGQLRAALLEFATREAELRGAESRAARLLDGSEADAAAAFATAERLIGRHADAAARYREAIAIRRRLAGLSAAIHAPPVHPPTLASQLGERLRDRTRLAERHEHAAEKAELAERVAESCAQRAADLAIARRQIALEWAIVTLLVAQTALLLADVLASRGSP